MARLPGDLTKTIASYFELSHEFLDYSREDYNKEIEACNTKHKAKLEETHQKRKLTVQGLARMRNALNYPIVNAPDTRPLSVDRVSILRIKTSGYPAIAAPPDLGAALHFYYKWNLPDTPTSDDAHLLTEFIVSVETNMSDELSMGGGAILFYHAGKEGVTAQFQYHHFFLSR